MPSTASVLLSLMVCFLAVVLTRGLGTALDAFVAMGAGALGDWGHLDAAGHLPTPTEVAVTSIPAHLEHLGEPFCREVVGLEVEEQVGLVGEAAGDRDASLGCGLDRGALVSSEGVQGDDVAPDDDGLVLEISELQEQRVHLVEDREEALFVSH